MARFVLPVAMRRSTSTSRAVSPPVGSAALGAKLLDTRARSGAAPERRKIARAASSSIAARVLVSERAAREPDKRADARRLVRRFQLAPAGEATAQDVERASSVAFGEQDRAVSRGARGRGRNGASKRVRYADSSSAAARVPLDSRPPRA